MHTVLTIDGPAGSGKSTTAREVAAELGWRFLDTGAMYRAMTVALLRQLDRRLDCAGASKGRVVNDPTTESARHEAAEHDDNRWLEAAEQARRLSEEEVATYLSVTNLEAYWSEDGGTALLVDQSPVEEAELRLPVVSRAIKVVADHPKIRERLVWLQRSLAGTAPLVTEGRDQGSVAFPDAPLKFFLTATIEARAQRRLREFQARGVDCSFAEVRTDVQERDAADRARRVGRLVEPPDAVILDTTELRPEQVVDVILQHARALEVVRRETP